MNTEPNDTNGLRENTEKQEPEKLYLGLSPSELKALEGEGVENYEQSFEEEKEEFDPTDIETEVNIRERGSVDRADRHQQDAERHSEHDEAPIKEDDPLL